MEGVGLRKSDAEIEDLIRTPCSDSLVYSEKEQEILDLWSTEEELRLERGLLEAQGHVQALEAADLSDDALDAELKKAETEALEARAAYVLRTKLIQHVLLTDPVLKSVHTGANGNALEQKLLALINERDILAMVNSVLSKDVSNLTQDLSAVEKQNAKLISSNAEDAKTMLRLAEEVKLTAAKDVEDPEARDQLRALDDSIKRARRDWRIMKSVVSAVVAGSGINWAKDENLRELVLDNEDEIS